MIHPRIYIQSWISQHHWLYWKSVNNPNLKSITVYPDSGRLFSRKYIFNEFLVTWKSPNDIIWNEEGRLFTHSLIYSKEFLNTCFSLIVLAIELASQLDLVFVELTVCWVWKFTGGKSPQMVAVVVSGKWGCYLFSSSFLGYFQIFCIKHVLLKKKQINWGITGAQ